MRFTPNDPFPLVECGAVAYPEMQSHAAGADNWLGMKIDKIEADLFVRGCRLRADGVSGEKQQLWIGLGPKSLLTPYIEIRQILHALNLPKNAVVADLGAAYGRMGFVVGKCFPELKFLGFEFVGERVQEFRRCASRFNFGNVEMIHADLSSPKFQLVQADVYFIYDYGTPKAIRKTLHDLRRIAHRRPIHLIVRGSACHDEVQRFHSWLVRDELLSGVTKSSIYRSKFTEQALESSI